VWWWARAKARHAILNQRVDRRPAISAERPEAAETRRVHAAQRDDRAAREAGEGGEAHRPQRGRSGVRAGREGGREEEDVRALPVRGGDLAGIMRRGGAQATGAGSAARGIVASGCALCPTVFTRQQHNEPLPPGRFSHLLEQRAPFLWLQAIMPEDDAAAAGQAADRGHQRLTGNPFVGEQPEAGQGL